MRSEIGRRGVPAAAGAFADWIRMFDGWPNGVGCFGFHFGDGRWDWSDHIDALLGYEPGMPTLSATQLLSHVHPDDHERVTDVLADVRRRPARFSLCHRVIDSRHDTREIAVIGGPFYGADGNPAGVLGFCLELASDGTGLAAYAEAAAHLRARADRGHTTAARQRIRRDTRC